MLENILRNADTKENFVIKLIYATNNLGWVHQVIESGIDINYQDQNGNTLLHHAIFSGKKILVDYILKKHPNLWLKNNDGLVLIELLVIFKKGQNNDKN